MANIQGLQKICDILTEHPEWSLGHLAAQFSVHHAFSNPTINSHFNSSDPLTGMSPLQVAVKTQIFKTVQMLIDQKCSLEHLDHSGNSVFHYAANTNKDIIAVNFSRLFKCRFYINYCIVGISQKRTTTLLEC